MLRFFLVSLSLRFAVAFKKAQRYAVVTQPTKDSCAALVEAATSSQKECLRVSVSLEACVAGNPQVVCSSFINSLDVREDPLQGDSCCCQTDSVCLESPTTPQDSAICERLDSGRPYGVSPGVYNVLHPEEASPAKKWQLEQSCSTAGLDVSSQKYKCCSCSAFKCVGLSRIDSPPEVTGNEKEPSSFTERKRVLSVSSAVPIENNVNSTAATNETASSAAAAAGNISDAEVTAMHVSLEVPALEPPADLGLGTSVPGVTSRREHDAQLAKITNATLTEIDTLKKEVQHTELSESQRTRQVVREVGAFRTDMATKIATFQKTVKDSLHKAAEEHRSLIRSSGTRMQELLQHMRKREAETDRFEHEVAGRLTAMGDVLQSLRSRADMVVAFGEAAKLQMTDHTTTPPPDATTSPTPSSAAPGGT